MYLQNTNFTSSVKSLSYWGSELMHIKSISSHNCLCGKQRKASCIYLAFETVSQYQPIDKEDLSNKCIFEKKT